MGRGSSWGRVPSSPDARGAVSPLLGEASNSHPIVVYICGPAPNGRCVLSNGLTQESPVLSFCLEHAIGAVSCQALLLDR